jgi:hypothetical protein
LNKDKVVVPDNNDTGQLYLHLCQSLGLDEDGFDPTNTSVCKSMVALLTELNHLFSTKYEIVVQGYGNKLIHYVRVLKTSSDDSFRSTKEWLDIAIRISGSKEGDTFNSAYRITNHLWCFYKDTVLAACEKQRIAMCKPMTATRFATMIKAAKITGVGEREVQKYLSAELRHGFCPTQQSVDILSDGHVEVKYDSINFTFEGKKEEEFIKWTEKIWPMQ